MPAVRIALVSQDNHYNHSEDDAYSFFFLTEKALTWVAVET